jgi:subtilisin family serine protease
MMYARYFVVTLLLVSLLIPTSLAAQKQQAGIVRGTGPIVDSMLRMDLASKSAIGLSSSSGGCKALLQFDRVLSPREIAGAEALGIQFATMWGSVVRVGYVYSALVPDLGSLMGLTGFGLVAATSGNREFFPSLDTSVAAIGAPTVWNNMSRAGNAITGKGMKVALIDTGVNWLHPSFWRQSAGPYNVLNPNGTNYVDLNSNSIVDAGDEPISSTGANDSQIRIADQYAYMDVNHDGIFDYSSGDRWLGGIDANGDGYITFPIEKVVVLGESKVSMLFDQQNNRVYVRGVNLTSGALGVSDPDGHGTHVASIIAGGQIGSTSMVGVAPGADLIVIKSPLESSDILEGIYFAIANGAEIINMSFSSFLGFLDGTDLEDLAISDAFLKNHTVSTIAAGNLGQTSKHASFQVGSGTTNGATLSVSSPPLYSYINVLWRSDDSDEHVVLVPPTGSAIDFGAFSSISGSSFSISRPQLNAYVFADTSIRGTNRLIVQIATTGHNWSSGLWEVNVANPSGEAVLVDAYAWDNAWAGYSMHFASQVDNARTISSPATADYGVCVSCYDEGSHSISSSSGRGPRIDGVLKPDVAAPGISITAASNSIPLLWAQKSGSSMAAPHVAGLLALIGQASGGKTGWTALTALLEGAGGHSSHDSPPLNDWGYGLCDSVLSVREVLGIKLGTGSNRSDWAGIEEIATSPQNLTLSGGLDILNIELYQQVANISLAITLRGEPKFVSQDVLMLQWDTDMNYGTGPNGADIVVNVTEGSAVVFMWSGTQYLNSSQTAHYWNDTKAAFVTIEQPNPPLRGRIRVSTHNQSFAYADLTPYANIVDQWRPLVNNVSSNGIGTTYQIQAEVSDRDDASSSIAVGWSLVDGGLNVLKSALVSGAASLNVTLDLHDISSPYVVSIMLNVTDGSCILSLAPIILSSGVSSTLKFTSTKIDQATVAVGPFVSSRITGQLILEGYLFASTVRVAFHSELGFWLNFTLSGNQGVYPIDIVASAFSAGQYDVYAVATGSTVGKVELLFTHILVFSDYSVLALVVVGVFVVLAAVKILPRFISKKQGVQG